MEAEPARLPTGRGGTVRVLATGGTASSRSGRPGSMPRVLFELLLICAIAPLLAQQSPPSAATPALTIRGVVIDARGGAALRRARISVISGRTTVASVLTDDDGRFS